MVENALGMKLDPEGTPNEANYASCRDVKWWHAVDLITTGHWRDLLDTARFTEDRCIVQAVGHGLRYRKNDKTKKKDEEFQTRDAREVMERLGLREPPDKSGLIASFMAPNLCRTDGGSEHWAINRGHSTTGEAEAWGIVIGMEEGWFGRVSGGFLQWTKAGRAQYPSRGAGAKARAGSRPERMKGKSPTARDREQDDQATGERTQAPSASQDSRAPGKRMTGRQMSLLL